MTDAVTPEVLPPSGPVHAPEPLGAAIVVYILYLVGFVFAPTAVVGVIMAHTGASTAGPIAQSHFSYQTRTFWYGLLTLGTAALLGFSYLAVNFVAMLVAGGTGGEMVMPEGVPPVLMLSGAVGFWWFVWTLVRCVKGLVTVFSQRPMPKPTTLLW